MNLKSAIKYQISDTKAILIYYSIVITVLLLMFTGSGIIPGVGSSRSRFNGYELATMIFLFVGGANSFRETFLMFIQNGISRKTLIISQLYGTLIISSAMAFIDRMVVILGKFMGQFSDRFSFQSLIEVMYAQRYADRTGSFFMHFDGFWFSFAFYSVLTMAGYFISVLFYRLNKGGKILVSVGVPVGLFMVYPIVDAALFQRKISLFISRIVKFAFGFQGGLHPNPYYGVVTGLLLFAVLGGLAWVLTRKAILKNNPY